ncbi:hypothetical protein BJY01DRAFT_245213 [Aspergillus pseudoustus]|uniref:Fe2OG dioxygenase domain-containing protein n=1 Tax=Aspergillus pseudoustus TaxID=1810923 RepID=A0ABR4KFG2_9EURO
MTKAEIPIISFEPFLKGDATSRRVVATQIYQAFHDIGFLYLKDSGITQEQVDNVFKLSRAFFDLPFEYKQRYAVRDPTENQGYSSDTKYLPKNQKKEATSKPKDHKEAYEHRRFDNPLCPPAGDLVRQNPDLVGFQKTLDTFYADCFQLCKEILRCLAIALNIPGGENFFDAIIEDGDPQLRLTHYPPVPASLITPSKGSDTAGKDGRILPHCDYGFCTLLFQDKVGGLEVDPFHTGEFIAATPKDGTVLINLGDLLHRLLNGRVKSTMHRVVSPETVVTDGNGEPMLPDRYSIPFFVHPIETAWIDPVLLSDGETRRFKGVNAGTWRSWRTSKIYGMEEQEQKFFDQLGIADELSLMAPIRA